MSNSQAGREIPPIIFIHYGNSPYLVYTLAQAALICPERPVWLIGDETNQHYPFVHHVHYQQYSTHAFSFAEQYLHLNGNHPSFELFCFQRWFILRDFMVLNKIEKAVYLDSDILLFDNLDQDWQIVGSTPLALCGVAPPAFINDVQALDVFCNFMDRSYRLPTGRAFLNEYYRQMLATGIIGGICDMTFWKLLREQLPEAITDLTTRQPRDASHDRNIELPEEYQVEEGLKKIHWIQGVPYGKHPDGTEVRFKSLHMHRKGKELISHFFQAALASLGPQSVSAPIPRIVLDGVFFQYRVTGIARVWEEILRQWAMMPIAGQLVVLDRDWTCPRIDGLRYRTIARHDYTNPGADQQMLQQVCDEEKATCFVSTYYSTPLTTPSLLMIHDCTPEALGADLSEPSWQEKRHAIEYASSFCTVSDHTAKDLLQHYPEVANRPLLTIHNGVSDIFAPANYHEINQFQTQFGITKPYYLFVGPVEWYKNFTLLIEAFNQLPNRQDYLIVRTRAEEDETPAMPGVITTGRLSDAQLCAAYSGALALVYPSWYEGFGLPVVEAMACGCPVIAANATSIPEVAGGAAWLIPPHERDSMVTALLAMQQPEVRQHLSQAGLKRAQQFSWKRTAEELMEAIYTHGMIV